MSATALVLISLLTNCNVTIDIDYFKSQYATSIAQVSAFYDKLYIREEIISSPNNMNVTKEGGISGDYVKSFSTSNQNTIGELLCPKRQVTLNSSALNPNKWSIIRYHSLTVDKEVYSRMIDKAKNRLPRAFKLPFSIEFNEATIMDCMNGKNVSGGLEPIIATLDTVKLCCNKTSYIYRLYFSLKTSRQHTVVQGNVDIDPSLSWVITRGTLDGARKWSIEYSNTDHGVPLVKQAITHADEKMYGRDAASKPSIVRVTQSKVYDADPREYELIYYGITDTPVDYSYDPAKQVEVPLGMWIGLGSVICFILGILLIARAKRRDRKSGDPAPVA
jgi:hypothetical protein